MIKIVLLRHGESIWNRDNLFTGWTDVDLSEKGILEAKAAGHILEESGLVFDIAFTSYLKKAIRTLWIVLDKMDLMWIPVKKTWRLNERHYGALQGLNKAETAKQYGEDIVHQWRRSFSTRPPALEKTDKRHPSYDQRYKDLSTKDLPEGESLEDTLNRVLPYWDNDIVPELHNGKKIIIAAHGNSLRALIKHLDKILDEEIVDLNIPTGVPLVYELNSDLTPFKKYYLGDSDKIRKATEAVEKQGKIKE
jgi:2,3-bisphosphoglycerate-dependent phosphoglycerate mutase